MCNRSILFAACAALLPSGALRPADGPSLAVGRPLPDLLLASLEDGRPRRVSELLGKRTLLVVFASW